MTQSQFVDFLSKHSNVQSHFVIVFCLFAGGIGFPIQSDFVLLFVGFLSGLGIIDFKLACVLCVGSLLLGDSTAHCVGKVFGDSFSFFKKFRARFSKIETLIQEHPKRAVFMVRFTPFLRSVWYFSSGVVQISFKDFFLMDFLSTVFYAPSVIAIGFFFTHDHSDLMSLSKRVSGFLWLLLVFAFVQFFIIQRKKERLV